MKLETSLELGQTYRDEITGFEGVCTGVTIYLNGCIQALLEPKDKPDAKHKWIDEQRLGVPALATAGGPQSTPPGPGHPA